MITLHARPGWGSAIVELQLALYGIDFATVEHGDMFTSEPARTLLAPLNPITQLPTMVLEDGEVMTESAAITLLLAEMAGSDALVPLPGDPARAAFLRWLVFIVANIYPCFTFADDPSRFVPDAPARPGFRAAVDAHEERLWGVVEQHAKGPWFLGERMSAIDLYLAVMTQWRPKPAWFEAHAPKLAEAARRAREVPALAATWKRNFAA